MGVFPYLSFGFNSSKESPPQAVNLPEEGVDKNMTNAQEVNSILVLLGDGKRIGVAG